MKLFAATVAALCLALASAHADPAAVKELAPTGKLPLGLATGAIMGAGIVIIENGTPRGVAVDLGRELAQKAGVPVEYVTYPNSGALTEDAGANKWDVAFIPVDETRKQKVDFGSAHIVL